VSSLHAVRSSSKRIFVRVFGLGAGSAVGPEASSQQRSCCSHVGAHRRPARGFVAMLRGELRFGRYVRLSLPGVSWGTAIHHL
jgi:hypothetical protein